MGPPCLPRRRGRGPEGAEEARRGRRDMGRVGVGGGGGFVRRHARVRARGPTRAPRARAGQSRGAPRAAAAEAESARAATGKRATAAAAIVPGVSGRRRLARQRPDVRERDRRRGRAFRRQQLCLRRLVARLAVGGFSCCGRREEKSASWARACVYSVDGASGPSCPCSMMTVSIRPLLLLQASRYRARRSKSSRWRDGRKQVHRRTRPIKSPTARP